MTDRLQELQQVAEAATPGPWHYEYDPMENRQQHFIVTPVGRAVVPFHSETADARFIATFNPETVLKLLAVVRAAANRNPLGEDQFEKMRAAQKVLDAALAALGVPA